MNEYECYVLSGIIKQSWSKTQTKTSTISSIIAQFPQIPIQFIEQVYQKILQNTNCIKWNFTKQKIFFESVKLYQKQSSEPLNDIIDKIENDFQLTWQEITWLTSAIPHDIDVNLCICDLKEQFGVQCFSEFLAAPYFYLAKQALIRHK